MKKANQAIGRSHLLVSVLTANPLGISLNRILEHYEDDGFVCDIRTVRRDIEDLDAAGYEIEHTKGTGMVRLSREAAAQAKKATAYRTDKAEQQCMQLLISYFEKQGSLNEAALLNRSYSRMFPSEKTGLAVNENFTDILEELSFAVDEKSYVQVTFVNGSIAVIQPISLTFSLAGMVLETNHNEQYLLNTITSVETVDSPMDTSIIQFPSHSVAA